MQYTTAKTLVDVQGGLKFARSPQWLGNELLFVDVHDRCIKSTDLSGTVQTVRTLSFLPGCFAVLDDGGLIVGDARQRKIYLCNSAAQSQLADLVGVTKIWLSDAVLDNRGGLYVGDVGYDFLDPSVEPVPSGLIVHINAKGESSVVAGDLFSPHGMIITPDNHTLIVAETLGHRLTAFDVDKDGSLHNRRVWAQFQNDVRPDGICLDLEGAIWAAGMGPTALRVWEGGEVDHMVATRRPVFATMLGGPERRHLFLCTSASNDPVITRRHPDATIDIAEVATPGPARTIK